MTGSVCGFRIRRQRFICDSHAIQGLASGIDTIINVFVTFLNVFRSFDAGMCCCFGITLQQLRVWPLGFQHKIKSKTDEFTVYSAFSPCHSGAILAFSLLDLRSKGYLFQKIQTFYCINILLVPFCFPLFGPGFKVDVAFCPV